ncbi:hypothetical protein [Pseudomonas sp. MWU13-2105]|uniref:hypothetical protein n=1 Tax=Pseudomonas sp. MWU13-2105 TaxID=2935074 RepID=UPI00200CE4E3|nr:hypothetical protein [Pseudomonas sp. MWU13-2105]
MAYEHLVYGIAIKKNADIQYLTEQVQLAQNRVAQKQASVDSLQAKATRFANSLAQASANQASALVNYNLVKDATASAGNLASNFGTLVRQADRATEGATQVAQKMASLASKLIFSVEVVNKVAQLVNKQKALNRQLPDSLIEFMANATRDANNAVALTLTALQSCYAAESTLLESSAVIGVANNQANSLKARMEAGSTGIGAAIGRILVGLNLGADGEGMLQLLQRVYGNAVMTYNAALVNNSNVSEQLTHAQGQLALANMTLGSLQAGLKAATAAAYAA